MGYHMVLYVSLSCIFLCADVYHESDSLDVLSNLVTNYTRNVQCTLLSVGESQTVFEVIESNIQAGLFLWFLGFFFFSSFL